MTNSKKDPTDIALKKARSNNTVNIPINHRIVFGKSSLRIKQYKLIVTATMKLTIRTVKKLVTCSSWPLPIRKSSNMTK